jgi:hypothetical protein
MKKQMSLILGLALLPLLGRAQDTAPHWYFRVGGALDAPVQNWNGAYKLGGGAGLALGYALDAELALQLEAVNLNYSGTNAGIAVSDSDFRFVPTLRYSFGGQDIRPYLLAGAGLALEMATADGVSQSYANPVAVVGAGENFRMDAHTNFFLQVEYSLIFTSDVTGQDLPVQAGLDFAL